MIIYVLNCSVGVFFNIFLTLYQKVVFCCNLTSDNYHLALCWRFRAGFSEILLTILHFCCCLRSSFRVSQKKNTKKNTFDTSWIKNVKRLGNKLLGICSVLCRHFAEKRLFFFFVVVVRKLWKRTGIFKLIWKYYYLKIDIYVTFYIVLCLVGFEKKDEEFNGKGILPV